MPGLFKLDLESIASLAIRTASMICLPLIKASCCELTSLDITHFSRLVSTFEKILSRPLQFQK
uniref:Putative ovule protein n=1 Tax=Solanum chacoense TaxID=4108 RepID=A0A0V0H263_SOLCH